MHDIKQILVALADSANAAEIFNYAAKLAGGLDAGLVVVSVINSRDVDAVATISSMGYNVDGEHYVESVRNDRRSRIEQIIAASGFAADTVKITLPVGNPVETLLKMAVTQNVDLIVMGIKGRTNLEYMFIGSVAEKLFHRSPVPIVSYRDPDNAARLRRRIHTR